MRELTPDQESLLDEMRRAMSHRFKVPFEEIIVCLPPGVRRLSKPGNIPGHDGDDESGDT